MSAMGPESGTDQAVPVGPAPMEPMDGVRVIHRTDNYREAERFVDQLSDRGFPVDKLRIVGSGLRSVERITGRMTKGRAALAGAGTGAWIGLFVGLLFALFVVGPAWWGMMLWSLLIGAVFGAVLGFVGHWATRGERDFTSVSGLQAETYEVQVDAVHADEALRMASQT